MFTHTFIFIFMIIFICMEFMKGNKGELVGFGNLRSKKAFHLVLLDFVWLENLALVKNVLFLLF